MKLRPDVREMTRWLITAYSAITKEDRAKPKPVGYIFSWCVGIWRHRLTCTPVHLYSNVRCTVRKKQRKEKLVPERKWLKMFLLLNKNHIVQLTPPTDSCSAPLSCHVNTFHQISEWKHHTHFRHFQSRLSFIEGKLNLRDWSIFSCRMRQLKPLINAQLLLRGCGLTGRADGVSGAGEECVKALGGHPAGPSLVSGTRSSLPCQLAVEHTVVLIHDRHLQKQKRRKKKKTCEKHSWFLNGCFQWDVFDEKNKSGGREPTCTQREKGGGGKKTLFFITSEPRTFGAFGKSLFNMFPKTLLIYVVCWEWWCTQWLTLMWRGSQERRQQRPKPSHIDTIYIPVFYTFKQKQNEFGLINK